MTESEQLTLLENFTTHLIVLGLVAIFVAVMIAITRKSW